MSFKRRISLTDIEQLLRQVANDGASDPTALPAPRPADFDAFLETLYRHASYVVARGKAAYMREVTADPSPPTRNHLLFAALVRLIHISHDLSNTQIADLIGMPRARYTALLLAADSKPFDGPKKPPSSEAIARLRAVVGDPFNAFEPLTGSDL